MVDSDAPVPPVLVIPSHPRGRPGDWRRNLAPNGAQWRPVMRLAEAGRVFVQSLDTDSPGATCRAERTGPVSSWRASVAQPASRTACGTGAGARPFFEVIAATRGRPSTPRRPFRRKACPASRTSPARHRCDHGHTDRLQASDCIRTASLRATQDISGYSFRGLTVRLAVSPAMATVSP